MTDYQHKDYETMATNFLKLLDNPDPEWTPGVKTVLIAALHDTEADFKAITKLLQAPEQVITVWCESDNAVVRQTGLKLREASRTEVAAWFVIAHKAMTKRPPNIDIKDIDTPDLWNTPTAPMSRLAIKQIAEDLNDE